MYRLVTLTLALTLAACSSTPTYDRGIAAGDSQLGFATRGTLASGDIQAGGRYVDAYRVDVEHTNALGVSMDSGGFDSRIELVSPSGAVHTVNSCEGTSDACVMVQSPEHGTWTIRATTRSPGESGGYTLAVAAPLPGPVQAVTDTGAPLASVDPALPTTPGLVPEPTPSESRAATAEQDASGTFTGGTERIHLDGRSHPAVVMPLRLLAVDGFFVRFESEDFEPLLVLTRDGETVEVARLEERTLGGESADLSFWVEETGVYNLYLATTDSDLIGDYTYEMWFERDDSRIYDELDLYEYPPTPGSSFSALHTETLRALLDAAPSFLALRGRRISGETGGEAVYESTRQVSESLYTHVVCRSGACFLRAVFPTPDVDGAGSAAQDLLSSVEEASDGSIERTVTSAGGRMSVELTSESVRGEISFNPTQYDERLGVPVTLVIEGR